MTIHGAHSAPYITLLGIVVGGCSQTLDPVFKEPGVAMVWPASPAEPRIRYVGQLRTSADVKAPKGLFQPLGDLLVGPKPPNPLYGPRMVLRGANTPTVWIADPGGRCVHRFDLTERSYRKIERSSSGPLLSPVGLCQGSDMSIFICDSESVAIVRLDEETGNEIESLRVPEELRRPVALNFHAASGELFVVDSAAHDIKVLDAKGGLLRIIGRRGVGKGELNYPCAIADDGELIWVVDSGNNRVQALTRAGEPKTVFGQAGDATGDLALPKSIAFDSDRNVYVVDARFENVQIFDRSGRLLMVFGEEGDGPGEFWLPAGIFIDPEDRIWVCDSYNSRIQVFDYINRPASQPAEVIP